MNKIELHINRFYDMKALKKGIVHKKGKLVYKYAKESKEIMSLLDRLKYEDGLDKCCLAKAFLYDRGMYYGYAMEYKKDIKSLNQVVHNKSFDIDIFFDELFGLLEQLKDQNLTYYDFHQGNVKVLDNKPYLLDMDSVIYNDDSHDHAQALYLTEFIIGSYLKGKDNMYIQSIINNPVIHDTCSNYFCDYLYEISKNYSYNELPFIVLDEFRDEDKVKKIIKSI